MPPQKVQTRQNSNRYQKRNEVNVMMNIAVVNNNMRGRFSVLTVWESEERTENHHHVLYPVRFGGFLRAARCSYTTK